MNISLRGSIVDLKQFQETKHCVLGLIQMKPLSDVDIPYTGTVVTVKEIVVSQ